MNVNASLAVIGAVNNNGTIDIASGQTLSVTTSGPNFSQNTGQINVSAGGILDISSPLSTLNGGTITLAAGASSQGVLKLEASQYTGSNTTATITSGTVGAGQSPGYVDLAGMTSTLTIGVRNSAGTGHHFRADHRWRPRQIGRRHPRIIRRQHLQSRNHRQLPAH